MKRFKTVQVLLCEENKLLDVNGKGVDLNYQTDVVKMTALHWAAYYNDLDTTNLLLQKGADPALNARNLAPVDIAAEMNHWDIVNFYKEWLKNLCQQQFEQQSDLNKSSGQNKF